MKNKNNTTDFAKLKKTLFLFRRDLRLQDNTGLINALTDSESVIPAFIFDPRQEDKSKNEYYSENAFGFMIESLADLNLFLKENNTQLFLFRGKANEVISRLIKTEKINAVYVNKDYTQFSKKRDEEIKEVCKQNNVIFKNFPDVLLNEPEKTNKIDGTPYTIFTAYWKNASKLEIIRPINNDFKNYYSQKIKGEIPLPDFVQNKKRLTGGRKAGLELMSRIKSLSNYDSVKDYPFLDGTSRISPHLKFGTISVREAYWSITDNLTMFHSLIRQLYWRDFFYHVAWNFPRIFGNNFNQKYDYLKWENDPVKLKKWCEGKTGYPIIDAGMRELNETGYMHNRVRMIVSGFLTKDLHIDWKIGEKYFAQKLVDYDPCLNNGNWQWAASTGCDASPYFRVFSPARQQEKFDSKCKYIKKWVDELKEVPIELIHSFEQEKIPGYPSPIVNHKKEAKIAIESYKPPKN